ncbi:hypothetical protein [Antrihabitans stalactiti]|uniref:Uncharacterized protein n=1 Tax=Antrihabitans stalactiti TaxID=2584121 RepID=A0A848KKP7_9NOCA|nr:hypothetical protein [Antrihabitans stalactiti]NMN99255.1 hypothetical protein [Antrihabitans stalactiti]
MGRHSVGADGTVALLGNGALLGNRVLVGNAFVPAAYLRDTHSWGRAHTVAAAAVALIGVGALGTIADDWWARESYTESAVMAYDHPIVLAPAVPAAPVAEQPVVAALPTETVVAVAPVVPQVVAPAAPAVPTVRVVPTAAPIATAVAPQVAEPAPQVVQEAPAEPVQTRVGQPDGSLLFPGEPPPPPLIQDPGAFQQWMGNHLDLKVKWLEGR